MVILPGRRRFGGNDAFTKLLLHFDGADGATATTDASIAANAVTFNGTAQLDTAQKEFGASSLLLDGDSDYLSIADSANWTFGTDNFTFDFWFRCNALPGSAASMDFYNQTNTDWNWLYITNALGSYYLRMNFRRSGATKGAYSLPITISTGAWHHAAFVRNGATGYIFFDGDNTGCVETTAFSTNELTDISAGFNIGADSAGTGSLFNGWLDEFRISKGIARWTANFTPPTVPYR